MSWFWATNHAHANLEDNFMIDPALRGLVVYIVLLDQELMEWRSE